MSWVWSVITVYLLLGTITAAREASFIRHAVAAEDFESPWLPVAVFLAIAVLFWPFLVETRHDD